MRIIDTGKKTFKVGDRTYRLTKAIADKSVQGVELIFKRFIPIKGIGIGFELSETIAFYRPLHILMSKETRKIVGKSEEYAEMWLRLPKPITDISQELNILERAVHEKQSTKLYGILTNILKQSKN